MIESLAMGASHLAVACVSRAVEALKQPQAQYTQAYRQSVLNNYKTLRGILHCRLAYQQQMLRSSKGICIYPHWLAWGQSIANWYHHCRELLQQHEI